MGCTTVREGEWVVHEHPGGTAAGTGRTGTGTSTSTGTGMPSCAQAGAEPPQSLHSSTGAIIHAHSKNTASASQCSHRSEAAQPLSRETAFTKIESWKCCHTAAKYSPTDRRASTLAPKTKAAKGEARLLAAVKWGWGRGGTAHGRKLCREDISCKHEMHKQGSYSEMKPWLSVKK